MASSVAGELMAVIDSRLYKSIVPALPLRAGMSEFMFPKTTLSHTFSLDVNRWLEGLYMNPNAMYDMFGQFSGETGAQVCCSLQKYLGITKKKGVDDCALLKQSWIALHMQDKTPQEWANGLFDADTPGDEIVLFALSRMFH